MSNKDYYGGGQPQGGYYPPQGAPEPLWRSMDDRIDFKLQEAPSKDTTPNNLNNHTRASPGMLREGTSLNRSLRPYTCASPEHLGSCFWEANLGSCTIGNSLHNNKVQGEAVEDVAHVLLECVSAVVQKVRFSTPLNLGSPPDCFFIYRGMRVSFLDIRAFRYFLYDLTATSTSVPVVDVRKGRWSSPSFIIYFSPYSCLPLSACKWTRAVVCFYHVAKNNWTLSFHDGH